MTKRLSLPKADNISYEMFQQVDIRCGTIVSAENFSRSTNPSFKVQVDFGPDIGILQTSSQVALRYRAEALIGKKVMGCVNVGEKNIAGFLSQFLLLGFYDQGGGICLAMVDPNLSQGVENGEKLT